MDASPFHTQQERGTPPSTPSIYLLQKTFFNKYDTCFLAIKAFFFIIGLAMLKESLSANLTWLKSSCMYYSRTSELRNPRETRVFVSLKFP